MARAVEIWVMPPRIFKTGEEWILKQVRSCDADGYLARNYDHLNFFKHDRRRGDFSLNVANPLTAEYFIVECGLERLTASYDLNIRQLDALLRGAPPAWFEITIHQHMPLFHMEHCVFCAFLTKGKDYRDCGRPCDTREVRLRDRVGALHTLKADAGCRNTLYNSRAQTGAEFAGQLAVARRAGLPHRISARIRRRSGAHARQLSQTSARRNHRPRTLARTQGNQPTRRDPRDNGVRRWRIKGLAQRQRRTRGGPPADSPAAA